MTTDNLQAQLQAQPSGGHAVGQSLPEDTMRLSQWGAAGNQQQSQALAQGSMQGPEGGRGVALTSAGAGAQSYIPWQHQQLLQPPYFPNVVTSGMPLPEQRPDLGSLESAQFATNNTGGRVGALDSLTSGPGNAICRTALFNNPGGQAAARNIVLTVAATSAAPSAAKSSDMETMPSAESQKAPGPPANGSSFQPPHQQPTSGVATRGLRAGARRNPPRYSDFTEDLSDTDSQEVSFYDESDEDDGYDGSRRQDLRSHGSSLQSANESQFRSAMSGSAGGDGSGREARRGSGGIAPKRPRSKTLLCEQDPDAPGLTLEQRRKIRR